MAFSMDNFTHLPHDNFTLKLKTFKRQAFSSIVRYHYPVKALNRAIKMPSMYRHEVEREKTHSPKTTLRLAIDLFSKVKAQKIKNKMKKVKKFKQP